ncbi:MAG: hypothetical protein ABI980_07435 [Nitrospirota bacterium]
MAPRKEYEMESGGEALGQVAARLTDRAEELAGVIGETMGAAKETIQDGLRRTKKTANDALGTVVDSIETSTEYFTERGMEGVVDDVETLIRRYPFQVLFIGLAVGYLISRAQRR